VASIHRLPQFRRQIRPRSLFLPGLNRCLSHRDEDFIPEQFRTKRMRKGRSHTREDVALVAKSNHRRVPANYYPSEEVSTRSSYRPMKHTHVRPDFQKQKLEQNRSSPSPRSRLLPIGRSLKHRQFRRLLPGRQVKPGASTSKETHPIRERRRENDEWCRYVEVTYSVRNF